MQSLAGTNKVYVGAKGRVTKKGNLMVVVDVKDVKWPIEGSLWQETDEGNGVFVKLAGEFEPLRAVAKKWFNCQVRADGRHMQVACEKINRDYGFATNIL